MKKLLHEEIAHLTTLPAHALESRHEALFGRKPETNHRQFLFRKIAWRIQADREGGLSEATKELANAIAQEAPSPNARGSFPDTSPPSRCPIEIDRHHPSSCYRGTVSEAP